MPGELLGRADEIAEIGRFLDALTQGPHGLVIGGEAGIGKTAMWDAAVGEAAARDLRVLSCRPAESESAMSFAALADLLGPVADDALPAVPPPQRRALEVALLRAESGPEPPDERIIAAGLLSVLGILASDGPLLVAIDDAQWLDPPTARAIGFAVRRLADLPVGILVTVRTPPGPEVPLGLDRSLSGVRQLALGRLSLAAIHHLVRDRVGMNLTRPALLQIEQLSGGNPLHALEIALALGREGVPILPRALPLTESLLGLVDDRVRALPATAREALLVASAVSRPTTTEVVAVLGDRGEAGLQRAAAAGTIWFDGDRVRFAHPLLATAVRAVASPERLRRLHAGLAERTTDPEERARHMAAAAAGPDAAVADALDAAADAARSRGSPTAAADCALMARDLTPPDDPDGAARRTMAAAGHMFEASDINATRRLGEEAVAGMRPGPERARALMLLGTVCYYDDDARGGIRYLQEALDDAMDDLRLRANIHARLAWLCYLDLPAAASHADAAIDFFDEDQDPGLVAFAIFQRFWHRAHMGLGADVDLLRHGIELEAAGDAWESSPIPGHWWRATDRFDAARERYHSMLRWAEEAGDESSDAEIFSHLAENELWAGNWEVAHDLAVRACDGVQQMGQVTPMNIAVRVRALVEAHLGLLDAARETAAAGLARAEEVDDPWYAVSFLSVLGPAAWWAGDAEEAVRQFARARGHMERMGMRHPLRYRFSSDEVEALIALGETDRAAAALSEMERRAEVIPHPWALAVAARSRALLAATAGDLQGGIGHLEEALGHHADMDMPFELGRTLLALGRVQRRDNRRRDARSTLERALGIFRQLGAATWIGSAEAEHARLGLRHGGPDDLTPSEERVASLSAGGLTNREVAAQLFMSPKTVEANLSRIYRKLGIRTRAELGARMAEREPTLVPPSPPSP